MIHPQGFNLIGITVSNDFPGNQEVSDICNLYGGSQLINFYTMKMDDLLIIAKYRILPVPTLLILSNNKVIGRIVKDIPSADQLQQIISRIV